MTVAPSPPWHSRWFLLVLAGLSIVHVLMASGLPIMAWPGAKHDAGLFVVQAGHLRSFNWLGPYDELTLAKGPGFPLWMVLTTTFGLPLLVANALLHATGAWLWASALVRLGIPRGLAALLFALLLFNPAYAFAEHVSVHREGLYMAQTSVLIGLLTWQVAVRAASLPRRAAWAALLGLHVTMMWITREEGVWLLPGLAGAALAMLLLDLAQVRPIRRALLVNAALVALAAIVAVAGTMGVAAHNARHYGVRYVVEFNQPEFKDAYGALTRVEHERHVPKVPLTLEAMDRIAAVSPAFAAIKPTMLEHGRGLIALGCELHQVSPCDGELRAAWMVWLLRHALAVAGQYRTGPAAAAYYDRLASEVNAACDSGRLRCGPRRSTFLPPFRTEYIPTAVTAAWLFLRHVVAFSSTGDGRISTGDRRGIERFEAITLSTAWPRGPQVTIHGRIDFPRGLQPALAIEPPATGNAETTMDRWPGHATAASDSTAFWMRTDCVADRCLFTVRVDGVRILDRPVPKLERGAIAGPDGVIVVVEGVRRDDVFAGPRQSFVGGTIRLAERLRQFYERTVPALVVAAAVALLAAMAIGVRQRRIEPLVLLAWIMVALAASRLALLGYLDATSFSAWYPGPLYPLVLAIIGLAFAALWRAVPRRRHPSLPRRIADATPSPPALA